MLGIAELSGFPFPAINDADNLLCESCLLSATEEAKFADRAAPPLVNAH